MKNIMTAEDFFRSDEMTNEFIIKLESNLILESNNDGENYKEILNLFKKIKKDFKLQLEIVGYYGTGIGSLYGVVEAIINNSQITVSKEAIVLAITCALTIIYQQERENTFYKDKLKIKSDCKYLLEELKLKGIGNGIIKKLISIFTIIKNFFKLIFKKTTLIIINFIDLFSYVSILIPTMNAIAYIVVKYNLTLDSFILNIKSILLGIGGLITKNIIQSLLNKLEETDELDVDKQHILNKIENLEEEEPIIKNDNYDEFEIIKDNKLK